MKIVFFGTPEFVVPVLRAIAQEHEVVGVVTAPDKAVGRKKVMTPNPVKIAAQELGIPMVSLEQLPELAPDLCVVAAYNKIIPEKYLSIPRLGFLNIHPSLLPAYRGPSPVRSAILDGCAATGVSIIRLDAEMDHGPILAQEFWRIPSDAYAPFCEEELFRIGAQLLLRSLDNTPLSQDHTEATYTKKFTREDGRLDLTRPAQDTVNRIRALADNPGTWITLPNGKTLNILRAHLTDGKVVLDEVQLEGGKAMSWDNFQRGHPLDKIA